MTTKFFQWLAPTSLLAVFFTCNPARAQSYRVAHTSDGFLSFEYALINNSGVVVFSALRRDPSGTTFHGVYKGKGGSFSVVVEAPLLNPSSIQVVPVGAAAIDINNAGAVALNGFVSGSPSVYLSRGGVGLSDSVDSLRGQGLLPTITDQGFLAYGPSIRGPFPDLRSTDPTVFPCDSCTGNGRLNNRNQYLIFSGLQIIRVSVDVVMTSPQTSKLAPIRSDLVATVSSDVFAGPGPRAMMNDSGTVVYYDIRPGGTDGIYKGTGAPVVEQQSGSEFTFNGPPPFAIDNGGAVAFLAHSRTLSKVGFFRGSSPFADKIVAEGDTVAGSQVFQLSVPGGSGIVDRWFNDNGQIVFEASDQNGGTGLYVTGGVPSPPPQNPTPASRFEWNPASLPPPTPPSGSFGDTNNWVPLDGSTVRVPEKTSTHADIAIFDRAEVYTVDVGAQHNEQVIVRNGNVIFEAGAYLVDGHLVPTVVIDNARLHLLTAMGLTNLDALIGKSAASRVDVGFGGRWISQGSLQIGGPGHGILNIDAAGTVISAESRIGTGVAGGQAIVNQDGSWTTGNLAIGAGGRGELTITNGGHVESDAAVIGQQPSLGNIATLQGNTSRWDIASLTVGDAGTGRLEVKDGALLNAVVLRVAQKPGVTGSVKVSGVSTDGNPSSISTFLLVVGGIGVGDLSIEDGGYVRVAGDVILSELTGSGTVTVTGINAASGHQSALSVDGLMQVGNFRAASMVLDAGGSVLSERGAVFSPIPGTTSEVRIIGNASQWEVLHDLTVGANFLPPIGAAVVTLVDGLLRARTVEVRTNGVIQGFGILAVDPTDRVVNGGTVSPGLSPGTITINGSYEQTAAGRLLIEIAGTNSAEYDHLIVTNAATLDGNITFKFINGFAPKAGDHFDFLSVGGVLSNTFATVGLQHLTPGFQFNFATNGPLLRMTALNNGVFDTTLPGHVDVSVTNIGGISYATYVITTSNTCQSITLDGALTQTGNVFSQAFQGTRFVGGGCTDETDSVTNTVLLGALPAGDYTFRILTGTQAVQTVAFTVPPNAGKTLLDATRLSDGSVQFQIDGLAPTRYTIEASEDLQNWIPLGDGTLPDTFTDPDAAIFPTRYYRARIAP